MTQPGRCIFCRETREGTPEVTRLLLAAGRMVWVCKPCRIDKGMVVR